MKRLITFISLIYCFSRPCLVYSKPILGIGLIPGYLATLQYPSYTKVAQCVNCIIRTWGVGPKG